MQPQPWAGPGHVSGPLMGMTPFIHTSIPLMFIESLRGTRLLLGVGLQSRTKEQNQALISMGL